MSACRQCGFPDAEPASGLCLNCRQLMVKPDNPPKAVNIAGRPVELKDMKSMDETRRWREFAAMLKANRGRTLAFLVDCGPGYEGKGDRYIAGVKALVPDVTVIGRLCTRVPGCEMILFKLP